MAKKILAVLGDYYHRKDWAIQALESAITSMEETIEIEYSTVDQLVENVAGNPDAVILFAENRINPEDETVRTWMDEEEASVIARYVENGGGWLAWHSGLASYDNVQNYTSMLHGYFKYHPPEHQQVTYYPKPNSELVDKGSSFSILDEHYFVECDETRTNVFLITESVDGSSIGGWNHRFGKGNVVCLIPAHLKEGLMNDYVQKLLISCVRKVIS
ncbi:ThuA domain-containing protein [Gracilibacillus kekensis]|uniref:Trehalose utilisation n=1 Tax=Gracilibacillus kekensis TaxID=1027249 RepID=A0A1M7JS91_9BACI|nr:ThuA domain-containing protein [Gracilibacillus kekensis]SHM55939.1 Trehalose utilisation [Gracilibacillus kekensis]